MKYLLAIFILLFGSTVHAQLVQPVQKESIDIRSRTFGLWVLPANGQPVQPGPVVPDEHPQTEFRAKSKDWRFFAAVMLVIFFGLAKTAFRKMYNQLVLLMFRTTVRSRQIREQLQSTTIASMVFNLLFVVSASLLLMVAIMHYAPNLQVNHFVLWLLCAGGVAAVYIVKYCWLKIAGWVFQLREPAEAYLFFVFFMNKIVGIFLIPLIVLLLMASSQITGYLLIISYFMAGFFMLYRYYLAYGATQKTIKASSFHFLLYICAVEITPLLLIYKALFNFLAY